MPAGGPPLNWLAYTQSHPIAHAAFEWCAYFVGGRIYLRARRAQPLALAAGDQLLLFGCTLFGAAAGSVALHFAASYTVLSGLPPAGWIAGKSVLGGLLGGTIGTEVGKHYTGWRRPTGDAWVPALLAGLVIGRLGCQLAGTWDMTYGSPTGLPWGWDYGDGVRRYPTGLIEIGALLALAGWLYGAPSPLAGQRYNRFLGGYCLIRLFVDFLKPPYGAAASGALVSVERAGVLTAIQWAALAGAAWMALRSHQLRKVP